MRADRTRGSREDTLSRYESIDGSAPSLSLAQAGFVYRRRREMHG